MIKGNRNDVNLLSKYPCVLKFIHEHNLEEIKPGKYILNEIDYVNIEEYNTKSFDEVLYENHKLYLDIHYMINGSESIYVKNEADLHEKVEYDKDRDIEFKYGSFSQDTSMNISKDEFVIIPPSEFHAPCLTYEKGMVVKKAVFKIRSRVNMIKALVMDVDGTLTDGKINISEKGELFKSFNVKDGYGIANLLPKMKIIPIIITGRNSEIVQKRCEDLNIKIIHQGIHDKITQLKKILYELNITPDQVAYIGDDLNDIDCLKYVGMSACPADATSLVIKTARYVCKNNGGSGAVREFIDWMAKENK